MADDQVKYSDLIAQDVQPGLTMLAEALKAVTEQIASLKTEATALKGAMSAAGTATREQQQATAQQAASVEGLSKKVKQLTEEERRLEEVRKRYKKLTDEQIERVNAFQQALRGSTQQQMAAVNAIEVETKSYNELNAMYNALKDSLNAMTVAERQNTEAGKAMTMQSAKIYDTMNELQKATGKYTLQVGKYRAAFDGLGYSFQQILREAPSALNLNQFFLAISNNIPMFLDQLKAFKNEQAEIQANLATMTKGTAEYAEQLGKVESVGKKLGKVLISWQSLVLVGLMILRNWDRIVSGITSLFSNLTKEQKMLKAVNEEAASTVGELTAKYEALRKEWQSLKAEDQGDWLKQHQNDWNELGISIDNANDAENLYVQNTSIIQKAIDDRARSMAAMKLAAEKYEEVFKLQVKAEKAQATMRSMEEAGTAYEYRKERTRYIGNAATGSVTTITTPAGNYKTGAYAQAGLEYEMYKRQYEEVKKDAEDFLKFVKPDATKGGGGGGKKEKDPTEQNTTDKYWEAEQALLEAQQEGYDLERSLAKLNRDKQRDELINWYVDQRLALDENLKNGFITQEKYDSAIIELDHQNKALQIGITNQYNAEIAKINNKAAEEERKAREAQEKAAEKAAKDGAKAELKAAVDGWAEYKAKLVEEGNTRKQIVEAEVAAEIARLNLMLKLNRDVNGEIMSDEQKAKVQEWINLLEKLQQTGNYGDYKPGQFMGKGGANVTNERKNYANIWEVLGIDMDNNQVSALNNVFDQAKEALNSWMDARKAAADQAKELADDEVAAAENALNREIELRNQGYANDVALREKELAKAKENQKKSIEQQQKYKEQELAINTAMEASNMAVAVANIFKQFTFPYNVLMAAAMVGAWGAAKISALNQVRTTKYREGGVMLLEGGSHESGHDVNLGIGPDGSNLRAEGGEYFAVINKRSSRKYGSQIPAVVNALNSGMFEDRYIKTSDAVGLLPQVIKADNGTAVDLSSLEGGVDALVKQGESRWSTEGEWRVMRYKNLTRRVRIS